MKRQKKAQPNTIFSKRPKGRRQGVCQAKQKNRGNGEKLGWGNGGKQGKQEI